MGSRFRGDGSFRTWLSHIAVNVCLIWKQFIPHALNPSDELLQSLDDLTGAVLRVDYAQPDWFEWKVPGPPFLVRAGLLHLSDEAAAPLEESTGRCGTYTKAFVQRYHFRGEEGRS